MQSQQKRGVNELSKDDTHKHKEKDLSCLRLFSPGMRVDTEDVAVVEFMCVVFTRMPGDMCHRRLRSLLWCCVCVTYFEL